MTEVTDEQIVELYHRRWLPPASGHFHGPTLWATWDGKSTVHLNLQPGIEEPAEAIKQLDPELAATVTGLSMPTTAEILAHGVGAFARWIAAGLPIVTAAQHQARAAACVACDLWDADARLGLGMCKHRDCGCTSLKWWLKTERCPAGKWSA